MYEIEKQIQIPIILFDVLLLSNYLAFLLVSPVINWDRGTGTVQCPSVPECQKK